MITIKKSPIADTRTCDWTQVTPDDLLRSSEMHIVDVEKGLAYFAELLKEASYEHDRDKITDLAHFHNDFKTGFKETGWWDNHRKVSRHHLAKEDGVPDDVNLTDVQEFIVDCVMAGMARSGSVYELKLPDELLQRAFQNSVKQLLVQVEVAPE